MPLAAKLPELLQPLRSVIRKVKLADMPQRGRNRSRRKQSMAILGGSYDFFKFSEQTPTHAV